MWVKAVYNIRFKYKPETAIPASHDVIWLLIKISVPKYLGMIGTGQITFVKQLRGNQLQRECLISSGSHYLLSCLPHGNKAKIIIRKMYMYIYTYSYTYKILPR